MEYTLYLSLIVLGAVANFLRGSGKIKKVIVYAVYSLALTLCVYFVKPDIDAYKLVSIGVVSFLIDWLCNSFGWGAFIPHGRYDPKEGGFKPARWCADMFFDAKKSPAKWQTTAMSFRFFLTFGLVGVPILSYSLNNFNYLYVMPLFLICGLIYRLPFLFKETKYSLGIAEFINGGFISSIRGLVIFLL